MQNPINITTKKARSNVKLRWETLNASNRKGIAKLLNGELIAFPVEILKPATTFKPVFAPFTSAYLRTCVFAKSLFKAHANSLLLSNWCLHKGQVVCSLNQPSMHFRQNSCFPSQSSLITSLPTSWSAKQMTHWGDSCSVVWNVWNSRILAGGKPRPLLRSSTSARSL